jgi:hypothetical protein
VDQALNCFDWQIALQGQLLNWDGGLNPMCQLEGCVFAFDRAEVARLRQYSALFCSLFFASPWQACGQSSRNRGALSLIQLRKLKFFPDILPSRQHDASDWGLSQRKLSANQGYVRGKGQRESVTAWFEAQKSLETGPTRRSRLVQALGIDYTLRIFQCHSPRGRCGEIDAEDSVLSIRQ